MDARLRVVVYAGQKDVGAVAEKPGLPLRVMATVPLSRFGVLGLSARLEPLDVQPAAQLVQVRPAITAHGGDVGLVRYSACTPDMEAR